MFERFTEKARRVIFFARYEASAYGSATIETGHLLLGLLREDAALATLVLRNRTFSEQIREEIEKRIERHEQIQSNVEIPLTKESKRVLTLTAEEAERLGHRDIDTAHLLLGLLRVEEGLAAQVLRGHGITAEVFRQEIAREYPPSSKTAIRNFLPVYPREILEDFVAVLKAGV